MAWPPAAFPTGASGDTHGMAEAWAADVQATLGQVVDAGARVGVSGTQSIPNATWTTLLFDIELRDTDGYHSASLNTGRMTIPAGKAGWYVVGGAVYLAPNGTNWRISRVTLNGGEIGGGMIVPGSGTQGNHVPVVTSYYCAAGDYLTFDVYQDSGGALTASSMNFWIQRIGAV